MRFRVIHHIEFSVLDYDNAIAFYDRMFGWLGDKSYWSLDIGIHHIALWARSWREAKALRRQHPEWKHHPAKEMMRRLPSR
jgi:catechol 2,3-dioxygenase-like lactoylglutathione lyase family enzyme